MRLHPLLSSYRGGSLSEAQSSFWVCGVSVHTWEVFGFCVSVVQKDNDKCYMSLYLCDSLTVYSRLTLNSFLFYFISHVYVVCVCAYVCGSHRAASKN